MADDELSFVAVEKLVSKAAFLNLNSFFCVGVVLRKFSFGLLNWLNKLENKVD